jgi:hypothetical protein
MHSEKPPFIVLVEDSERERLIRKVIDARAVIKYDLFREHRN